MNPDTLDFSGITLSGRELEILLLAADGLTDKEICASLNLSGGSIRTYWERLRKKVGAASRGQAIAMILHKAYRDAAEKLRETQEWIRVMVEYSQDYAIFRTDDDGKLLSWNYGVEQLLQYGEGEFVGKNIEILFTEEDRIAGMPALERARALETGRSLDNRWHVRRDGVRIWVEGTLVSLKRGNLTGFAKIMQDRTEENEAKLQVAELVKKLSN